MDSVPRSSLPAHFTDLPDPRTGNATRHCLLDIVTIALCAVLCGADTWVDIELFGRSKEGWLRTFLALPHGIPSHDTFGRVFAALDPAAFERCFLAWVQDLAATVTAEVVAIDGKTLRRTHDQSSGQGPLHLVSAWARARGLVLGQVAVDDHSNERTAIPLLLAALALEDCVVTIDAIGTQPAIARQLTAAGADYVLALKANQPLLHELVGDHFRLATAADHATHLTVGKNHGRLERRQCWATDDPAILAWLDPDQSWPGLRSIAAVTGERRIGATVTRETRYYLTSLPADAQVIAAAVRGHWEIENRLHWVLDVAFREDDHRVRTGNAPQNFAILRHIALNLLRQDHTTKAGIKAKRLKCGWDHDYLLRILAA